MKKTINISTALITVALFSGSASAYTDKQAEDILHGNGAVTASQAEPYVQFDSGAKETEGYLLWNLHETENARSFTPYVQTDADRNNMDNRDDLINEV